MKMQYCSACASIDLKQLPSGLYECPRCKFVGKALEGSMDEINAFKTSLKRRSSEPVISPPLSQSKNEFKEKLDSLKGKKTDDFEIL